MQVGAVRCSDSLDVRAPRLQVHLVLTHMTTGKNHEISAIENLIGQRIGEAVQQRAPHTAVSCHSTVEFRMDTGKCQRGLELCDERATEPQDLLLVPPARLAELGCGLRPKYNARRHPPRAPRPRRVAASAPRSSAS